MEKPITIYLIRCFANGRVYIGQTSKTHVERLIRHVKDAACGEDGSQLLYRAMRKYGTCAFGVKPIDQALTKEQADDLERHYIGEYHATNPILGFNIKPGGSTMIGYKHSAKSRAKMRRSSKRFWKNPENRLAHSRRMTGQSRPKGKCSPEGAAAIRAASRKYWSNPESRINQSAALGRPEVRANRSKSLKAAVNRPEVAAKKKAYWGNAENRAKHSELLKVAFSDPQIRANRSAIMTAYWTRKKAGN